MINGKEILKIEPVLQRPKFGSQWYLVTFVGGDQLGMWSESGSAGALYPYCPAEEQWSRDRALNSPLFKKIKTANTRYREGKSTGLTDQQYDGMVRSLRIYYKDFEDLL